MFAHPKSFSRLVLVAAYLAIIPVDFLQAQDATQTVISSEPQCTGHLLTVNADGTVQAGSKTALQQAVMQGQSLRVGWRLDDQQGKPVIIHWADAGFISLFEGEVFAQIQSIHRQVPQRGHAQIHLSSELQHWTGLIGTNGVLVNRMDNRAQTGERKVKSWWCLTNQMPSVKTLECHLPQWRLLYQHDRTGKPLQGSKDRLIDSIRYGEPIRIGWGVFHPEDAARSVEHAIEPVFITITNQSEVSAQLPEHIAQASYWDPDQAEFADPAVMWRGLVSTTGHFDAAWTHRATGETVRRAPQQHQLTWYGQTIATHCQKPAIPLAAPSSTAQEATVNQ